MAVPPVINPLSNLQNESSAVANINQNLQRISSTISGLLSKNDTTQNTMNVPLDMNGQRILNLPPPTSSADPFRLQDVLSLPQFLKGDKGDRGERGDGSPYSVLLFPGVDPTGLTDSRVGLTNGVNALIAAGKKVHLEFPDGDYLISGGTWVIGGHNNVILGNSTTVRIINGNADAPAVQLGDDLAFRYNNVFDGFTFGAAPGVVSTQGSVGLKVISNGQTIVRNIKVTKYPSALFDGVDISKCSEMYTNAIECQELLRDGFRVRDSTDVHGVFIRSHANGRNGFYFQGALGNYYSHVNAFGNANNAFCFETGGANLHNENIFMENLVADTSGADNIFARDLKTSLFVNCWGCTQFNSAVNPFASGLHITTKKVFSNVFTNCVFMVNNFAGILSDSEDGTFPYKNSFVNVTLGAQNVSDGNQASGHGNGRGGQGGYGIYMGGGGIMSVTDGSCWGNYTAPVSVAAGGKLSTRGVDGINNGAPYGVPVGPSPWTYTSGYTDETLCISTGSGISTITSGGVFVASGGNQNISLNPNREITITYTSPAPSVVKIPR